VSAGDFEGEHRTVTVGPPIRETPGFGCPHCGAELDVRDRRAVATGLTRCCGGLIDGALAVRLNAARLALEARERGGAELTD